MGFSDGGLMKYPRPLRVRAILLTVSLHGLRSGPYRIGQIYYTMPYI